MFYCYLNSIEINKKQQQNSVVLIQNLKLKIREKLIIVDKYT